MTSKKLGFFSFVAAFAVVLSSASLTQAQTNQQNATGQTGTFWAGQSGNNSNGAQTFGLGGSGFQANDPSLASGLSATSGAGIAKQTATPTKAVSEGKAVLGTTVQANGANTKVSLSGGAGQGTWDNVGDSTNYANADEGTVGTFQGSLTNKGPAKVQGGVDAEGNTLVQTKGAGTDNSSALINTGGKSEAQAILTPQPGTTLQNRMPLISGFVTVAGGDGANLQSVAGNPNGNLYAGGFGMGSGSYQMTAPTVANGSVAINGATNGKIAETGPASAPTSVTIGASSVLTSVAQASGH